MINESFNPALEPFCAERLVIFRSMQHALVAAATCQDRLSSGRHCSAPAHFKLGETNGGSVPKRLPFGRLQIISIICGLI